MSKTRRKRFEEKLKKSKEDLKDLSDALAEKNRKQAKMLADRNLTLKRVVPLLNEEQLEVIDKLPDKEQEVKDLVAEFAPPKVEISKS